MDVRDRIHSTRFTEPTPAACSRRSFACSATSIPPKRRCTTRSRRRSSVAATMASRPIRGVAGVNGPVQGHRRRRRRRFDASREAHCALAPNTKRQLPNGRDEEVEDDRLRLIFTCCHPALAPDARVALTLREVCGLTTEEIARAFLTPAPTLAQRIVRAKTKIRDARIPYEVPPRGELPERLDAVLHVVYLVFNEGYSASSATSLMRPISAAKRSDSAACSSSCCRARGDRAARADAPARRAARGADVADGELCCSRAGSHAVEPRANRRRRRARRARARSRVVRAVHAAGGDCRRARGGGERRRPTGAQIVGLYDVLLRIEPSPVVELNRAVAVAMRDGAEAGLALVDAILSQGDLTDYHLAHSARAAPGRRRLGRRADAIGRLRARARAHEAGTRAAFPDASPR